MSQPAADPHLTVPFVSEGMHFAMHELGKEWQDCVFLTDPYWRENASDPGWYAKVEVDGESHEYSLSALGFTPGYEES